MIHIDINMCSTCDRSLVILATCEMFTVAWLFMDFMQVKCLASVSYLEFGGGGKW